MEENIKRGFKGVWIPKEVWLSTELSLREKVFLVEIDSLDGESGCFASNEHFSKFFNLSKNRCSEVITSLKNKGYLTIELQYKPGTKQVIKRTLRIIKTKYYGIRESEGGIRKTDRGIRKTEGGYSENRKDSNTIYSNTISNNIYSDFQSTIKKIYPGKKVKSARDKKVPKLITKYGVEHLTRVLERYKKEITIKHIDSQYILNESTFWNGRFEDYLDDNYEEPKPINKSNDDNIDFRNYVQTPYDDIDSLEKGLLGWND